MGKVNPKFAAPTPQGPTPGSSLKLVTIPKPKGRPGKGFNAEEESFLDKETYKRLRIYAERLAAKFLVPGDVPTSDENEKRLPGVIAKLAKSFPVFELYHEDWLAKHYINQYLITERRKCSTESNTPAQRHEDYEDLIKTYCKQTKQPLPEIPPLEVSEDESDAKTGDRSTTDEPRPSKKSKKSKKATSEPESESESEPEPELAKTKGKKTPKKKESDSKRKGKEKARAKEKELEPKKKQEKKPAEKETKKAKPTKGVEKEPDQGTKETGQVVKEKAKVKAKKGAKSAPQKDKSESPSAVSSDEESDDPEQKFAKEHADSESDTTGEPDSDSEMDVEGGLICEGSGEPPAETALKTAKASELSTEPKQPTEAQASELPVATKKKTKRKATSPPEDEPPAKHVAKSNPDEGSIAARKPSRKPKNTK